ncbi:hypothetical protein A5727_16695 [Mycobacterium sp. ACS4331]|nr:hypothetical protein A5727_16695 [Mycobacterium sp. ACS4331]
MRTTAAAVCLLLLASCAKQVEQTASESAVQPTTAAAEGPTTQPRSGGGPTEQGARGGPIGQAQGGGKGGPINAGSNEGEALASPITIPAIQQDGQPVDDDETYPGGVIGFVEDSIRSQCPDGTLCGFTVTADRQEPETPPAASAERTICAFVPSPDHKEAVTYTKPVTIVLDCVWHYTEPVVTDPDPDSDSETPVPSSDTPEPDTSTSETGTAAPDTSTSETGTTEPEGAG